MAKITKFPSTLISGDCTTSSLVLDGGSIIDQCIVTAGERGTFFLEQHLLYVVLGGSVKLTCGRQSWTVRKNEMILLRQPVKTDIHRVVEENYTSPISLDELAYLSGRSLSSFKREFQDIYGAPPARWIREKRLSKAHEMLRSSSLSVADVAYSLGFENPTHFSRIFKQQYGYAPSQS